MSYNTKFYLSFFLYMVQALAPINSGGCQNREPPFALPTKSQLAKVRHAVIDTSKGKMLVELYPDEAPWHVANFKYLSDKGMLRNLKFDVFIDGYIAQAGRIASQATYNKFYYTIPPEFTHRHHQPGALGMARLPNDKNPERRSSATQFHLILGAPSKMDGEYTIFGQVINGEKVLSQLQKDDEIFDIRVFVTH